MSVTGPVDVFVSYANAGDDPRWAEWIASVLEGASYQVVLQAWDFNVGDNFVVNIHEALRGARHVVAVLSPEYVAARPWVLAELTSTLVRDPIGRDRTLLPVMVRGCHPEGLLGPINYVSLVGLSENEARVALLDAVQGNRPRGPVPFPGTSPTP